jgi:hypothetical protein
MPVHPSTPHRPARDASAAPDHARDVSITSRRGTEFEGGGLL